MNCLPRHKRKAKRTHAEQQEFILENPLWMRRVVLYNRFQVAKSALVTGSCGLIGSEVSLHLARHGFRVFGIDNNQRAVFFGPEGDTSWSLRASSRKHLRLYAFRSGHS